MWMTSTLLKFSLSKFGWCVTKWQELFDRTAGFFSRNSREILCLFLCADTLCLKSISNRLQSLKWNKKKYFADFSDRETKRGINMFFKDSNLSNNQPSKLCDVKANQFSFFVSQGLMIAFHRCVPFWAKIIKSRVIKRHGLNRLVLSL